MYQQTIREIAASFGHVGIDPRHVEAWMRLEHSTLDGLSLDQFKNEVGIAIALIAHDRTASESLAQSYGL